MSQTNRRRKVSLLGVALGLALMFTNAAAAFAAQASVRPQPDLVVAMHYVVPPFKAGAKVRTPEAIESALAEDLASRLGRPLQVVALNNASTAAVQSPVQAEVALARVTPDQVLPSQAAIVPVLPEVGPMAIMRTDTDIKSWSQLAGRTVCVSEGGAYTGTLAAQYGAIEKVYRAPADALLSLRVGGCDAAVHDDFLLKALLKLPEWKKFSAKLQPLKKEQLAFVLPSEDEQTLGVLKEMTRQWKAANHLQKLNEQRARDIAFEVYLDQVVADCH